VDDANSGERWLSNFLKRGSVRVSHVWSFHGDVTRRNNGVWLLGAVIRYTRRRTSNWAQNPSKEATCCQYFINSQNFSSIGLEPWRSFKCPLRIALLTAAPLNAAVYLDISFIRASRYRCPLGYLGSTTCPRHVQLYATIKNVYGSLAI